MEQLVRLVGVCKMCLGLSSDSEKRGLCAPCFGNEMGTLISVPAPPLTFRAPHLQSSLCACPMALTPAWNFLDLVMRSESVAMIIGPEGQGFRSFELPRDLLESKSVWWKTYLDKHWSEDGIRPEIRLDSIIDTVPAFTIFAYWLYHDRLPGTVSDQQPEGDRSYLHDWLEAWIFADKLKLPELQNLIMLRMYQLARAHRSESMLDDWDVAFVVAHGSDMIKRFALEALLLSTYSTSRGVGIDYQPLFTDTEFRQYLWEKDRSRWESMCGGPRVESLLAVAEGSAVHELYMDVPRYA